MTVTLQEDEYIRLREILNWWEDMKQYGGTPKPPSAYALKKISYFGMVLAPDVESNPAEALATAAAPIYTAYNGDNKTGIVLCVDPNDWAAFRAAYEAYTKGNK